MRSGPPSKASGAVQLVGFFIVEDRVQRGAEELTLGLQLDAGWESAAACLKAALEGAFGAGTAAAASLLAVKHFVLLACDALGAPVPCALFLCDCIGAVLKLNTPSTSVRGMLVLPMPREFSCLFGGEPVGAEVLSAGIKRILSIEPSMQGRAATTWRRYWSFC